MSQYELDSAVAQATGESLQTIRRRGFSIIDPSVVDFDSSPIPSRLNLWTGTPWTLSGARPSATCAGSMPVTAGDGQ